ncbi:type II toxin-antitoxin system RatA family toxin [Meiothermus granaticius]|uniref:Polyketide cyclase / dehydrase and lipid transport n=1 Tax=Meiothermus granaticius NBRC 107808 TaxID=1227551 RepID=A0A399F9I0_9DEIN|nr:SRPBCC family protein [Meiothermus granaticius]RIH93304.1 Polyketide cyclase / dehydrase and lipid transport [Meiothermus granaticius NBRC 107808]GEM85889.1 cyclase [Meiothermus granaticius NBRC 107808]
MPTVRSELFIPQPPAQVYAAAKDLEGLKPFLKDVESLRVLEAHGSRSRSEWVAVAMGKKVRWIEDEEWFDSELRNTFSSAQGDFDKYQGAWRFLPEGQGTRVVLDLEYELNIPIFGGLLQKLILKLMQENCDGLLQGLKERCQAA